jgi:hypothetical protein
VHGPKFQNSFVTYWVSIERKEIYTTNNIWPKAKASQWHFQNMWLIVPCLVFERE